MLLVVIDGPSCKGGVTANSHALAQDVHGNMDSFLAKEANLVLDVGAKIAKMNIVKGNSVAGNNFIAKNGASYPLTAQGWDAMKK